MISTTIVATEPVYTAQELLQKLTELVSMPKTLGEPVGAPQIYLRDAEGFDHLILHLEEEKLTDGSRVFNIVIG